MSTLAKRYAEALLTLAIQQDKVKKVKEDIDYANTLFSSLDFSLNINLDNDDIKLDKNIYSKVKGLETFFKNVKLDKEVKNEIVKNCLEDKVDPLVLHFIYILIEKNRISNYQEIFSEYHRMANHELHIKEGIIESVRPLDEKKLKELEETLSTDKQQVVLIPKLNDTLISGFKITFENEVIDVSMKEKIKRMEEMLNGKDDVPWI